MESPQQGFGAEAMRASPGGIECCKLFARNVATKHVQASQPDAFGTEALGHGAQDMKCCLIVPDGSLIVPAWLACHPWSM